MSVYFLKMLVFVFISVPLYAENCEWWDAACHQRNASGAFAVPGQVVEGAQKISRTIGDGAKTVQKGVEDVFQAGKDFFGGAKTIIEGDLKTKIEQLLKTIQNMQQDLFTDKEDGSVVFLTTYVGKVTKNFGNIGKIVGELDDMPDTVTPADLGKKVVAISTDLAVLNKISRVTGVFEEFLHLMEPVSMDLLSLVLLFARNAGRQDMEKLYLERTRQAKIFFEQMSLVLKKTGKEWDRLAPEITTAIKGAGELIQVMSGALTFLLKLGNLTTKDLLERAMRGNLMPGQSATLHAGGNMQVHALISPFDSALGLPGQLWQRFDAIVQKLGGIFEYGLDVLIPKSNKVFFLVDDELNDLEGQVAGLAKAHSIAQILSYLTPILEELMGNNGLIKRLLDLLDDVVSNAFYLTKTLTIDLGVMEIGPRFKGIKKEEIDKVIVGLRKVRVATVPMLQQFDKQLPKVIEILEPLAKVHAKALGKTFIN